MVSNLIQCFGNEDILIVNDWHAFDIESIRNNTKIIIKLKNLEDLKNINIKKILLIKDVHISFICSKQTFLELDILWIINNSFIKMMDINDFELKLDLFTIENVNEPIVKNNIKIIERIKYLSKDVQIHSKNHEILYLANQILKEYGKNIKEHSNLKLKIKELNNIALKI